MLSQTTRVVLALALGASSAAAQTVDDGLMMPKGKLSAGVLYTHDSWDEYWEGTLKRKNGNIGTLTLQSLTWVGGYGVTDRLSLMASVPYVWTHASQGVLGDLSGVQDLSLAAKFRLLTTAPTGRGAFNAFVVGTAAVPVSDYTPDLYPLSIGTAGGRASGRLTLGFQSASAWFINASSAYTWCSNVSLNRSSYYTDGQLYLTNEVVMPNVIDHTLTAGVSRGRWRIPVSLIQQRTLGGGDIRRQDMPFVSNRMDFVKLDGGVMYALPKNVSVRLGAAHVLSGRNVGQSTTFTSGLQFGQQF
ncbi:MAG: transporter [Gemmatimonadota bacterium]|nr:transporter [Gemmatimonadota bacterium]